MEHSPFGEVPHKYSQTHCLIPTGASLQDGDGECFMNKMLVFLVLSVGGEPIQIRMVKNAS